MGHEHAITAAGIHEVDLDAIRARFPAEADEIASLGARLDAGQETPAEFLRLCELLHQVGETREGEYLLRRNMDFYGGEALYARLYGDRAARELARAIACFGEQVEVDLGEVRQQDDPLDVTHVCRPRWEPLPHEAFGGPCLVRFDFADRDHVEAVLWAEPEDEDGFSPGIDFRFVDGQWQERDDDDDDDLEHDHG